MNSSLFVSLQAKNIKDTVDQIRLLERQVAESKTHLNNLVTLNEFCEVMNGLLVRAGTHSVNLDELKNDSTTTRILR